MSFTAVVQSLETTLPLYVDLDGTLLKTDILGEMALLYVFQSPWAIFSLIRPAMESRAALKRHLARTVVLRPESLPYNRPFLAWLQEERKSGRTLILATASDELIACDIAEHLGIFDGVMASNGIENLKGSTKLARIQEREGSAFDYAGNSRADSIIWENCRGAIPVCAPASVVSKLREDRKVRAEFPDDRRSLMVWSKLLRSHQWSKNMLVLLPVLTAHRIFDAVALTHAATLFVSLSLAASATYIFNDLHDLAADRQHHRKRLRCLASGVVSIPEGLAAGVLLASAGLALAAWSGLPALLMLLTYVAISLFYSLRLKKQLLVDVFTLSGLYTLRIIAGAVVTGIVLSGWLLSFSVFLFLSLGFSKRSAELRASHRSGPLAGRAYRKSDFFQLNQFGVASGFMSSLVLALYIGSDQVMSLYPAPAWLWFMVPLFLFWISRLWMLAYRGELNEDPVVFALTDRSTILIAGICFVFGLLATSGVRLSFMR